MAVELSGDLRVVYDWAMMRFITLSLLTAVACAPQPAEIRVKGPRDALESVKMAPNFAPLATKGETIKLRASAFDHRGRFIGPAKVRWSSSDPSVASVNQLGVVTALSSGQAQIRATSVGYERVLHAELAITSALVGGIRKVRPEKAPIRLALGQTMQFRAEVLNDRGDVMPDAKIRWSTSNYAATVTPNGEAEGRAIGAVQVVAENRRGDAVRWDVSVTDWAKGRRR